MNKYIAFLYLLMATVGQAWAQGKSLDKVIVKVDNHILLYSDLEMNFAQLVDEKRVPNTKEAKCQVLQSLVINKLFLAKAEIDSVVVDDRLVEEETNLRLESIMQGNTPEFIEELYGKPFEVLKEELQNSLKEDMIIKQMRSKITDDVTITPSEVRKYYKNLKNKPVRKTEVELAQIVKIPDVDKKERNRIKTKMEELRKRIVEGGESFEDLARVYCEDGSREDGGNLGWSSRGKFDPKFEAVAFKMKPNEVSKVFESSFGYHIVKLVERRGDEYWTKHILMMPDWTKVNSAPAENFLDSLRNVILKDSISFQEAAMKYSDDRGATTMNTSANGGFFQGGDGNVRIPAEMLDTYIYQAVDKMEVGDISETTRFRTQDGKTAFRILYLQARYGAHESTLENDYEKIQAEALADKKNKVLVEWFYKAKNDVFIDIDPAYDECKILQDED